jgi:light-regulated signal transduction histidine kinase (bacteriophytochrome)
LGEEADRYIHFAVDGAVRMRSLIDGLLSYSRVGRRTEKFEPVDLKELLDELLRDLQPAIRDAAAKVEIGPMPIVCGSRVLLGQLFQNLISNALKFKTNRAPIVAVHCDERDGDWEFAVADNGIGIESRHFDRVFQVFQRLHSRDQFPGTGIGLAICRKIVEQYRGKIWIESTPGEGTTFRFTLPKVENNEIAIPECDVVAKANRELVASR